MINNILKLIQEAELHQDELLINEELKGSTKRHLKTTAAIAGAGVAASSVGASVIKHGITNFSLPEVAVGGAIGAASAPMAIAGLVGHGIYKYLHSYRRLSSKVEAVKKSLEQAKQNKDSAAIQKYQYKLKKWEFKLAETKNRLVEQNKEFITRTSEMKNKLAEMKKNKLDTTSFEKKIAERESFIKKIGGKI